MRSSTPAARLGNPGHLAPRGSRPAARAQELEPRAYSNTPVGLNFLIPGYGYTQGALVESLRRELAGR